MVHWHIEVLGFTVPAQPNLRTRPTGYLPVLNRAGGVGRLRYTDVTAYGVCLLPSTYGMITGWETCGYEGLWGGQVGADPVTGDARPTGVVVGFHCIYL